MADLRICRIEGCKNEHPRSQFCCRVHWRALPKNYRDEIWCTYKNGQGIFDVEYFQACENAEAFLEDRDARDMGDVFD